MQKNQLLDLREYFERYCNVLPVFGFNSAKYDIQSDQVVFVTNSCNWERHWTDSYKESQSVCFFHVWRHSSTWHYDFSSVVPSVLTLSSKLTRSKRQSVFFPTKGSIVQRNWTIKSFFPMNLSLAFCAITTPLKKNYNDFQNFVNSGLTTEQAVAKLRMDRIPSTNVEKFSCLQSVWVSRGMQSFKDFSCGTKTNMLLQL